MEKDNAKFMKAMNEIYDNNNSKGNNIFNFYPPTISNNSKDDNNLGKAA
jgi:hypothetical protein